MAYICLDCYEVYKDSAMKESESDWYNKPCPKIRCGGYVVEVDELLLLSIKLLNQKGYITKFCCSGHTYESICNSYISFEDYVELPNLPKGYIDDVDRYPEHHTEKTNVIRKYFKGMSEIELQQEIFESAIDVLKWAESLEIVG